MQFFKQNLHFACFAGRRREKKEIIIMHTYLASVLRSASINTMNYRFNNCPKTVHEATLIN